MMRAVRMISNSTISPGRRTKQVALRPFLSEWQLSSVWLRLQSIIHPLVAMITVISLDGPKCVLGEKHHILTWHGRSVSSGDDKLESGVSDGRQTNPRVCEPYTSRR